jgi:hypothetical protein
VREITATSLLWLCSAAGVQPAAAARVTTSTPSHWADSCTDGHVPLLCGEAMRRLQRGSDAAARAVLAVLEPLEASLSVWTFKERKKGQFPIW